MTFQRRRSEKREVRRAESNREAFRKSYGENEGENDHRRKEEIIGDDRKRAVCSGGEKRGAA